MFSMRISGLNSKRRPLLNPYNAPAPSVRSDILRRRTDAAAFTLSQSQNPPCARRRSRRWYFFGRPPVREPLCYWFLPRVSLNAWLAVRQPPLHVVLCFFFSFSNQQGKKSEARWVNVRGWPVCIATMLVSAALAF